ncbi:MAG: hypothetical protein GYB67_16520, partial [Chloroflexi bacterium]|nr:hypothetical protein [Chloroflexota bacterium]
MSRAVKYLNCTETALSSGVNFSGVNFSGVNFSGASAGGERGIICLTMCF